MSKLWHDIQARELAKADPESWRDYLDCAASELSSPLKALVDQEVDPDAFKVPPEIRWAVWERDNFTCQYCGSRRFLQIDHRYPKSRGGVTATENLQTLCKTCNRRKHARVIKPH